MLTGKVVEVTRQTLLADDSQFHEVRVQLLNEDGEVVSEKMLSFPLDSSEDDIEKELTKLVELANNEVDMVERNKEREKEEQAAQGIANALKGRIVKVNLTEKMHLGDENV